MQPSLTYSALVTSTSWFSVKLMSSVQTWTYSPFCNRSLPIGCVGFHSFHTMIARTISPLSERSVWTRRSCCFSSPGSLSAPSSPLCPYLGFSWEHLPFAVVSDPAAATASILGQKQCVAPSHAKRNAPPYPPPQPHSPPATPMPS